MPKNLIHEHVLVIFLLLLINFFLHKCNGTVCQSSVSFKVDLILTVISGFYKITHAVSNRDFKGHRIKYFPVVTNLTGIINIPCL